MWSVSIWIKAHDGIIIAVGKHVVAQDALTCRGKGIRIQESTQVGIVVTGLEVIELGLSIVVLATDPQNSLFVLENNSPPEGELLLPPGFVIYVFCHTSVR